MPVTVQGALWSPFSVVLTDWLSMTSALGRSRQRFRLRSSGKPAEGRLSVCCLPHRHDQSADDFRLTPIH